MIEHIKDLMNEKSLNLPKLYELISKTNTADIAEALEILNQEQIIQVFRLLPKSMAAEVFTYLEPEKQQTIIEAMTDTETGKIVNSLFVDDAVDFIEEMPANVVRRVLQNVSPSKRHLINQLLQYPEGSAGSIRQVNSRR